MNYKERLKKLQQKLSKVSCDALLIENKTNLFYLTGLDLSAGKLLVHAKGAHLFVDSRYFEMCQKKCPFAVRPSDNPKFEEQLAGEEFSFIGSLGFESDNTTYKSYQQLVTITDAVTSARKSSELRLLPLDAIVKELREVKDVEEIELLRKAAALGSKGFDHVCTLLREGITEKEVALELEIFWKRHGSKGVAFDPIIAFGANSSMPHYRAGDAKLRTGDIVLIDIGVNLGHYHSDMTRIAFFGVPNPQLEEIHGIVAQAQKAALRLCRPGVLVGELDRAAREVIGGMGYGPNFTHSLGHGVGLDIHELPTIRNTTPFGAVKLQRGMVITIEPGIYVPELGGVRLENTIVITDNGYEDLTCRPIEAVRK